MGYGLMRGRVRNVYRLCDGRERFEAANRLACYGRETVVKLTS